MLQHISDCMPTTYCVSDTNFAVAQQQHTWKPAAAVDTYAMQLSAVAAASKRGGAPGAAEASSAAAAMALYAGLCAFLVLPLPGVAAVVRDPARVAAVVAKTHAAAPADQLQLLWA